MIHFAISYSQHSTLKRKTFEFLNCSFCLTRWPILALLGLIIALLLAAMLFDHLYPPDLHRFEQHSTLILDNAGKLLRGFTTTDDTWRLPLRPEAVEPLYLRMLKAYEDRRFEWHPGIDPLAVVRAVYQRLIYGEVISGASTLTMQTVRLLEPRPRTLRSKLIEMLRALQLEWHYNKDDILAMYLTLAPYGGNLEGLRAAALAYLGKEPQQLTPAEAALMVVLPQAPSKLRPDRYPERARQARHKVLARMLKLGILSEQQVQEAHQEELPINRHAMPFHAPHLARQLYAANPQKMLQHTFINGALQQNLEVLARQEQTQLDAYASLAILVVENHTRQVIAYLGAIDFFATQRAGQVDMVRAVRSPGSTLKPIIYGLGFDNLIIHPETLIDDIPTRFGDYSPTNFHDTYRGEISVREALQRSLNIPAVRVLERVGPTRVTIRLREAGIPLRWGEAGTQPGLPLALGGVGITLEDLVKLYAGIANSGDVKPLRYTDYDTDHDTENDSKRPPERPLLTPVASWYLTDILKNTPPPENIVGLDNTRQSRVIAYKTGTSYGFRDAWALGFDERFTVGVWVGRPDGSPSPGHYGRNTAAPLLFRIFNLLPMPTPNLDKTLPAGVILASNAQLPAQLRRLKPLAAVSSGIAPPLQITFPIAGSRVELTSVDNHLDDLPLIASGGIRPLRWLINGTPIPSSAVRRKAYWTPDGEGFVRITVIDKQGRTASAEVWVEKNEAGTDG